MYQIQNVSSDPAQNLSVALEDGTIVYISIFFSPQQTGWFIGSLTYTSASGNLFTLNGVRITNSPNMLHQFKNQLPFGLACISTGNREPQLISDFDDQSSILYILDPDDVDYYEAYLEGNV